MKGEEERRRGERWREERQRKRVRGQESKRVREYESKGAREQERARKRGKRVAHAHHC